jgi:hypothetical protein
LTPGRLWLLRGLAIAGAIVAALQLALVIVLYAVMANDLHMNDFGKFYYAVRAFFDGQDMYGPTIATTVALGPNEWQQFWDLNPPHFHLAILPLAVLPPATALTLWLIGGWFCLAFSIMIIGAELSIPWTRRNVFIATIAALAPSSMTMVMYNGQVTFILLLPVTYAWIAARRSQWSRAGVALGLAAGVKPFLGLFFAYLLLSRRWRAAAVMLAVIVLLVAAGGLVFGVEAYRSWLEVASRVDWIWSPMNGSVAGLATRTFGDNPMFPPLIHAPNAVRIMSLVVPLLIVGYTLWRATHVAIQPAADWAFAAIVFAALLASPLGWMYYISLAAGPITALSMCHGWHRSRIVRTCLWLIIPGLIVPPFLTGVAGARLLSGLTLGSLYTWTILCLWAAVLVEARPVARPEAHLEFTQS